MKSMRGKATLGGIVVLGLGLAFLLRGLGLDVGTGGDSPQDGKNSTTQQETAPEGIQADVSPRNGIRTDDPFSTPPEMNLPDTSEMLTVIVEERHYLWATNEAATRPVQRISLEKIVEKARQTEGNPQGIRVRIFHVGSALPSAETELINALKLAGLSELEIFFEQRVIELPVH